MTRSPDSDPLTVFAVALVFWAMVALLSGWVDAAAEWAFGG